MKIGEKCIEKITIITSNNEVIAVILYNEGIEQKDCKIIIKPASPK